jgi:N utilization substance protein B
VSAKGSQSERRRGARVAAVQALYQMDVAGKGIVEALAEFETFWIGKEVDGIELPPAEESLFRDILAGVVREQVPIDRAVDEALAEGWPLKRIELVLRAILRAGGYEMMFRKDVPVRVVINEYVEVAHLFYSEEEPRLVNGVLDAIGRKLRAGEMAPR